MSKYQDYIDKLIKDKYGGDPSRTLGRCKDEVNAMKERFTELTVVKGHVEVEWFSSDGNNRRGHWWLVDQNGQVVDPTAGQFPCIVMYEEYQEGQNIRIGKCRECGNEIWGLPGTHKDFCTDYCYANYAKYMNRECEGRLKFLGPEELEDG